MLKERFQRMRSQRGNGAGLDIRRQTGFDTDSLFDQKIHQRAIFHGLHAMTDTFGAQFANGLPDALRARRFASMYGNMPARITRAVKVREEQTAREAKFIAR